MIDGKVAVVTGATSGIGRATAIGLGKAGYKVAILGRREEELKHTEEAAGALYSRVCDVTDPAAVHRYFTDVRAKLGRVDVVFNNAGKFAPQMVFGDTDVGSWREMVDVNLNGAFYVAREAFRAMRDISAGITYVNAPTIGAEVHLPFGGTKATGNGHREGGLGAVDFYTQWKSIYVDFSDRLQRAQIDTLE